MNIKVNDKVWINGEDCIGRVTHIVMFYTPYEVEMNPKLEAKNYISRVDVWLENDKVEVSCHPTMIRTLEQMGL